MAKLITYALPYANGEIHLGHMVGFIQTDIWVRFQKMLGQEVYFVCADDAHGTPIMIKAQQEGVSPEELIRKVQKSHMQDLHDFHVIVDNYHSTHSFENKMLAEQIYKRLYDRGDIIKHIIEQAYDPEKNMFLPDRYVKGQCPRCKALDQYGDSCEACSATYSPTELINPVSTLSGATPILKKTEHFFFKLDNHTQMLKTWVKEGHLQEEIANKISEWFEDGLKPWDITRDAPYFGFQIPDAPGKFFYVWLDAPIGYMASFKQFCDRTEKANFHEFWDKNSPHEVHHFIGKDIIYFHSLFWPAMLHGANFRTPTAIHVHGFLTVNGQKMSKSRGTFIKARTYLKHGDAENLRYYFATKLTNKVEDLDLNFDDFVAKVNADLVGKVVNIASRCAKFLESHFDNLMAKLNIEPVLYGEFVRSGDLIARHYEHRDYARAIREIMDLADRANRYIDEQKPWKLIKDEKQRLKVQEICSAGLNLFRLIMTYLKPVMPMLSRRTEIFLKIAPMNWDNRVQPLLNHHIAPFTPLLTRIDKKEIDAMCTELLEEVKPVAAKKSTAFIELEPILPDIAIEDFSKIDLRVARIISAESIPEADKLIKLVVDLGGNVTKQIFAGIKSAFNPEELVGQLIVIVANLQPRKMRFGMSEGMVIVAKGKGKEGLWLLNPASGAEPGMKIS